MPRKMTDTTPLKGIPSRMPTSGFRSPPCHSQSRPNISRMIAGRKDGGIKLLEITEQPLGYAAAKRRKRQHDLEEQNKKNLESQTNNSSTALTSISNTSETTPDYAAGLSATSVYTQPPTPYTSTKIERSISPTQNNKIAVTTSAITASTISTNISIDSKSMNSCLTTCTTTDLASVIKSSNVSLIPSTPKVINSNICNSIPMQGQCQSTPSLPTKSSIPKFVINNSVISNPYVAPTSLNIKEEFESCKSEEVASIKEDFSIIKSENRPNKILISSNSKPVIISSVSPSTSSSNEIKSSLSNMSSNTSNTVLSTTSSGNSVVHIPRQTTIKQIQKSQVVQSQQLSLPSQIAVQPTQSKIVQIKAQPSLLVSSNNMQYHQNIPPLIPTQTQTSNKFNIQNIQNFNIPLNKLKLENANTSSFIRMSPPPTSMQHIQTSNVNIVSKPQNNQQNIGQLVISPTNMNMKGKTIILTNPNQLSQKGVIIRSLGPSGNTVYQQIPINNVSGLANIINTSGQAVVKSEQSITHKHQQIPALVPTSNYQNVPSLTPLTMVQQQSMPTSMTQTTTPKTTIIRPIQVANVQNVNIVPQGLTLIQRPGQQPQLIQTIQHQQLPRTILTQQPPQEDQSVQSPIRQQTIFVPQQKVNQQVQPSINVQQQTKKGIGLPVR